MTSDLPTIRLRPARRRDAGSILDWRNDAETRKLSGDTGEISVERHQAWFSQMLVDPGCWFSVAEDGSGQPFGVVRFNLDPDDPSTAEVSINLAPEYRGRGLGGRCLQSAIQQYRGENRAVRQIRARVHKDNLPSQRMFESAGFVYSEGPEGGFLVGWLRLPKVFSEGSGP
jgi:RimJ/RimL family protein N-acetyltransferase